MPMIDRKREVWPGSVEGIWTWRREEVKDQYMRDLQMETEKEK